MPVMTLRSLTMTKEEAAVARVSLAATREHLPGLLSAEGLAVLDRLAVRLDEVLGTFPPEPKPGRTRVVHHKDGSTTIVDLTIHKGRYEVPS